MSRSRKSALASQIVTRTYSADEINKRREYTRSLFALIDRHGLDYETEIKQLNGPGDPDAFYWHLYYKGMKINGGLVEGRIEEAEHAAEIYQMHYTRAVVMAEHIWDEETATWIPRGDMYYG